jgi:hypothetical protein
MATKSELTEEAKEALTPLGKWLSKNTRWRAFENYELCDDNDGLVSNAHEFIDLFTPTVKVQRLWLCYNSHIRLILFLKQSSAAETRLTAIRFQKAATVPVKVGSTVDLIPVKIISGTPSISNEELKVGQCVHLTKEAHVQPAFYCILLLSQSQ